MDIELFSEDIFRGLVYRFGYENTLPPRSEKFRNCGESKCSLSIINAVMIRRTIIRFTLNKRLIDDYREYSNSPIDFYIYLQHNAGTYIAYVNLNIFDKLLITCVLASELIFYCLKNKKNPLKYAPSCWAMYFDFHHKDEFYAKGGWDALELHTHSYLAEALALCPNLQLPTENDLLNAAYLFNCSIADINMAIPDSEFIKRVSKQQPIICQKHLPLHMFFFGVCYTQACPPLPMLHTIESYIQILLLTFSENERKDIVRRVLSTGKYKLVRKRIELEFETAAMPLEKRTKVLSPVDEDVYNKEFDSYREELKMLMTSEFLKRIFIDESKLIKTDKQCLFCGEIVTETLDAVKATRLSCVERINFKISKTVKELGTLKAASSKSMKHSIGKNKKCLRKTEPGLSDTLKLFLTLGNPKLKNIG